MGRVKCDHIKRLITLSSDNIKRLSLQLITFFLFQLRAHAFATQCGTRSDPGRIKKTIFIFVDTSWNQSNKPLVKVHICNC